MAIYHASVKTHSRSQGHAATAAAAYRAGVRLHDERTGLIHDYRRRAGVACFSVHVPDGAPAWSNNLETLWNRAEAAEVRANSRVARELEVALPAEVTDPERRSIAEELARHLVERYGVAVLAAVHSPDPGGDTRNYHVHLLFSTRVLGPNGFGEKVRVLDDRTSGPVEVRALRQAVEACINRHLEAAQRPERIDCRTLEAQAYAAAERGDLEAVAALGRFPTKHLGKAAAAARRRGRYSSRVDRNAAVARDNAELLSFARDWRRRSDLAAGAARAGSGDQAVRPRPRSLGLALRAGRTAAAGFGTSVRGLYAGSNGLSRAGRLYVDGLADTVRRNAEAFADAMHRDAQRDRRALTDRLVAADRERVHLARSHAAAANEAFELARRQRGDAMLRTQQARTVLEQLDRDQPSRVRVLSRREWARKRREQKRVAEQAEAAERQAHGEVSARASVLDAAKAGVRQAHRAARENLRAQRSAAPDRTPAFVPAARSSKNQDDEKTRAETMRFTYLPKKRLSPP